LFCFHEHRLDTTKTSASSAHTTHAQSTDRPCITTKSNNPSLHVAKVDRSLSCFNDPDRDARPSRRVILWLILTWEPRVLKIKSFKEVFPPGLAAVHQGSGWPGPLSMHCRSRVAGGGTGQDNRVPGPVPSAPLGLPLSFSRATKRAEVGCLGDGVQSRVGPRSSGLGRPAVAHPPDPASQTAAAGAPAGLAVVGAADRAWSGRGRSQCPRHQLQHCGNGAARPGGRRPRGPSPRRLPAPFAHPTPHPSPVRGPPTPVRPRPGPSPVSPMMMYLKR
jgi:hypothetical protein